MTVHAAGRGAGERLIGSVGSSALTGLMRSTRVQVLRPEIYRDWLQPRRAAVYVLWHGRLLPCSWHHRHHGLATLISLHRDGDYIARVVEGWGYHVLRGSSSRGGTSALRQMVRLLRDGVPLAVTPDGPRGPRQEMKLGPLLAAQLAGVPLICVTAGAARAWWFRSWDRFLVPQPLTRVRLTYGEPTYVPRELDEAGLQVLARRMESELNRLTEQVDRHGSA